MTSRNGIDRLDGTQDEIILSFHSGCERLLPAMSITSSEIQQALRISKVIEQHLSNGHAVNVRSEEIYGVVADAGFIARDHEKGKHLRAFLVKLIKANMLNLIPQCSAFPRSGGKYDWTFNRADDRMPARRQGSLPVPAIEVPVAE